MEKLIELLNEYREKELGYRVPEWEEKGQLGISKELLISKKFGFIKWLVENDKIDLGKTPYLGEYGMGTDFPTDSIIMLLAISDTPIEFLVSILK